MSVNEGDTSLIIEPNVSESAFNTGLNTLYGVRPEVIPAESTESPQINIKELHKTVAEQGILELNRELHKLFGNPFPSDQLVDLILEKKDYTYGKMAGILPYDNKPYSRMFSYTDDLVDRVTAILWKEYIEGCAQIQDPHKQKLALGILVDRNGLTTSLNDIRILVDQEKDASKKNKLSTVGSILMGYDPEVKGSTPLPFHTSIQSFYEAFDLRKYTVNLANKEREMVVIDNFLEDTPPDETVVEIGCGTGRLTNELAKTHKMIGIDINPMLLEQAKEADATGTVIYRQGTLYDTGLESGSVKKVIIPNRTPTHVETGSDRKGEAGNYRTEGFEGFVSEMFRIVEDGGEVLFDMPDPTKGRYLENKINNIKHQKNLGLFPDVNTEEEIVSLAKRIEYIIDTPDGKNFCQRFNPQIESMVAQILHGNMQRNGRVKVEIVAKTPIYIDTNDESVWIKMTKLPATQAQTSSGESQLSTDDE